MLLWLKHEKFCKVDDQAFWHDPVTQSSRAPSIIMIMMIMVIMIIIIMSTYFAPTFNKTVAPGAQDHHKE